MSDRVFLTYQRLRVRSPILRRLVSVVPGARHLHRWLFARVRPGRMTVGVGGLSVTVDPADSVLAAHVIDNGVWEPYETELFERCIQPGMVVVDVGANVGYYTLLAARAVGSEGRVIAFEPDPDNFRLLAHNVEANGFSERVSLVRSALSDRVGAVPLFRDAHNLGAHSLAIANVSGNDPVEVDAVTLDQALYDLGISHVDVVKMDTQGAEKLVFAGGQATLGSRPLRIFCEFWPTGLDGMGTDAVQFLRSLIEEQGFQVSYLDQDAQRLVQSHDPNQILVRCEGSSHVDILLERD